VIRSGLVAVSRDSDGCTTVVFDTLSAGEVAAEVVRVGGPCVVERVDVLTDQETSVELPCDLGVDVLGGQVAVAAGSTTVAVAGETVGGDRVRAYHDGPLGIVVRSAARARGVVRLRWGVVHARRIVVSWETDVAGVLVDTGPIVLDTRVARVIHVPSAGVPPTSEPDITLVGRVTGTDALRGALLTCPYDEPTLAWLGRTTPSEGAHELRVVGLAAQAAGIIELLTVQDESMLV
jgi:hypothetical protein